MFNTKKALCTGLVAMLGASVSFANEEPKKETDVSIPAQEIPSASIQLINARTYENPKREPLCVYAPDGSLIGEYDNEAGAYYGFDIKSKNGIGKKSFHARGMEHNSFSTSPALKRKIVSYSVPGSTLEELKKDHVVTVYDNQGDEVMTKKFTWDYIKANSKQMGFPKGDRECIPRIPK